MYLPDSNSPLEFYKVFKKVDCIVSDIDGTLTLGSTPIIEQIKRKTIHLRKNNVITTIATGRPYRGAYNVIQELGIAYGTPMVLYNGGILLEHQTDHIVNEYYIPFVEAEKIINIVSKCAAGVYVYTCDTLKPDIYSLLREYKLNENVYYTGKVKRSNDVNGNQVLKLTGDSIRNKKIVSMLIERKELSDDVFGQIMDYLVSSSQVSYTDSGSGFIEVRALQDRKSIIIDELRNRKLREQAQKGLILAIGDNDNDVDLFEAADISVAVSNASLKAKQTADYWCRRENAAGYLDMLVVLENAKKYWK